MSRCGERQELVCGPDLDEEPTKISRRPGQPFRPFSRNQADYPVSEPASRTRFGAPGGGHHVGCRCPYDMLQFFSGHELLRAVADAHSPVKARLNDRCQLEIGAPD